MNKNMIFCTGTSYNAEKYLKRISCWYKQLKNSEIDKCGVDYYCISDGMITKSQIQSIDDIVNR